MHKSEQRINKDKQEKMRMDNSNLVRMNNKSEYIMRKNAYD